MQVFWPYAEDEFLEVGLAGRGADSGRQRERGPRYLSTAFGSGTVCRFIAGEPMNPATNWFTGLSYS